LKGCSWLHYVLPRSKDVAKVSAKSANGSRATTTKKFYKSTMLEYEQIYFDIYNLNQDPATLSITTLRMKTLSITTHGIKKLSVTTLGIKTLGIKTLA
jgi:hypothetical protein